MKVLNKGVFFEISSILKKEWYELKHTSIKFLIVMILPFVSSIFIAIKNGTSGVLNPELNILCSFLFSGFFATILIKDSITREKKETTLPMLLLSNFHCSNIIIGKVLFAVLIGTVFQLFQILTMFIIMYKTDSQLLYLFNVEIFILLPLITFLMGDIVLLISTILQDEKTSDFVSMLLALFIGSLALIIYIYFGVFSNVYIYILYVLFIILINIVVTLVLTKILTNSMFFIKK
ncbi:hypothetical protein [uncultured Trichococcus sp.]|uniref:hypothetical protein n=1 Tax=uncultured Trichococcus sp. TaxID=189665 RepID=UPI0037494B22